MRLRCAMLSFAKTISLLDRGSSRRGVVQSSVNGSNNPECVGQCVEPTRSSLCAAASFPAASKISGLRAPAKSHFYLVHPGAPATGASPLAAETFDHGTTQDFSWPRSVGWPCALG